MSEGTQFVGGRLILVSGMDGPFGLKWNYFFYSVLIGLVTLKENKMQLLLDHNEMKV